MGMVDVTEKPVVLRKAEASGRIYLSPATMDAIRERRIKKGDPFLVAEVAAMNGAKQTHILIPHCHQIPLDTVRVEFSIEPGFLEARCFVSALAKTGVEMEALVGVTLALNTVWDMTKYLEKNSEGQYPSTRITDVMVVKKEKSPA